jgi:hypothetical protein
MVPYVVAASALWMGAAPLCLPVLSCLALFQLNHSWVAIPAAPETARRVLQLRCSTDDGTAAIGRG